MNHDDLTTMLAERAATVRDHVGPDRAAAVHQRVTQVRRRRTAAAVAAAVLVLAGSAGVVALRHDDTVTPAGRPGHLVGRAVPRTVESLGATYSYVRGYQADDGRLRVHLPKAPGALLVRLATKGDQGSVRLTTTGNDDATVLPGGDFGYSTMLAGDGTFSASVRSSNGQPVAMAVYRLSSPPPGYTRDGLTFPGTLAGERLLGAAIGEPGQDSVEATFPVTTHRLRLVDLCRGIADPTERYAVQVSIAGREQFILGGCGQDSDPILGGSFAASEFDLPAGRATVRARFTDSHGRPVAMPTSARIGLAVYPNVGQDATSQFDDVVEFDGHLWQRTTEIAGGSLRVDSRRGPVLVGWASRAGGKVGTVRFLVDGRLRSQASPGGTGLDLVATGRVSTAREAGGGRGLALATYQLVE